MLAAKMNDERHAKENQEPKLNKTRIDILTAQNLKNKPIKLDHAKVQEDASKIVQKKEK